MPGRLVGQPDGLTHQRSLRHRHLMSGTPLGHATMSQSLSDLFDVDLKTYAAREPGSDIPAPSSKQ